ncbi:hypothetical protein [Aliidiomarina maris]|uniref:Lipoprotein n=1 Tax=Aliidiomarina maris TaxID=531312 RepID=A0A327X2R5_9GAMM|nr:hypothetical protein [Aliidiomarina maris]MCL5049954.1 hypothetical protein [Bacillota bacterium]RAK01380.1 hypothetical protein B0I24_1013 [Aliidiomarina maris]RUO28230.1 hypothetical protein CWE07_00010 [Aliidiomarina maris]
MKFGMLFTAVLLTGCASVNSETDADSVVQSSSEAIDFIVEHNSSEVALKCRPRSKEVAREIDWVKECNQRAFDYLTEQESNSVEFVSEITEKPFGMAADFAARFLMPNPENFKEVIITQSFEYRLHEI